MGGQACIVYGASEFSRDVDLAICAAPDNLARLGAALTDLRAEVIAVPPFEPEVLARGHAVHFRCAAAGDMRRDVMAVMRGVPGFETCWARRTIVPLEGVGDVDVMGTEDLVAAKKTRPDKDWPVVRRLVDVHYRQFAGEPTPARVAFWLRELRTPEALVDCARRAPEAAGTGGRGHRRPRAPEAAAAVGPEREVVAYARRAASGGLPLAALRAALAEEEDRERAADDAYWRPLQQELEAMRHAAGRRQQKLPPGGGGPTL
ncbi:hypothetical protein rosag_48220 [Roseisolibacter agri]|uniref:Uncharacterized protein n=2 Tax=Roseisolibacter agri TaxID=2014610 RepID=A0AA37Q826_9BACT|nr:hypothetical protein rosag_48220 [Roseisolibacter agri]